MNPRQPVKTWSTPVSTENHLPVPCALCGGGRFKPSLSCEGFSYVKCRDCGLVQMNPQPVVTDVKRRYGESFGTDYLDYELKNEAAFLELQKLALADAGFYQIEKKLFEGSVPKVVDCMRGHEVSETNTLPKQQPSATKLPQAVDIGCATGAMPAFLKERGWQVTGVEISPAADYARKERGLEVLSQSFEDCRFPPESFDLVLASHLLEHLNKPGEFIREAWRVMRPGAYLMLTTPNIAGFQARLFGGRWRSAIFDHLYLFSARTLKLLLKQAGFTALKVYTWGGLAAGTAPAPVKRFADKAAKILGIGDVMLVKAHKSRVPLQNTRIL